LPGFKLTENAGSDRSWVWNCPSDFADEEAKEEVFAIRFANSESMCKSIKSSINTFSDAQKFKEKWEEAQEIMEKLPKESAKELEEQLQTLSVKDKKEEKEEQEK
jgi:hypothetical protein